MKLAYRGFLYEAANKPWNNFNLNKKDKSLDNIKIGFEFEWLITTYDADEDTSNTVSQEDFDEMVSERTNERMHYEFDSYFENDIYRGDNITFADVISNENIIPYTFLEDIKTSTVDKILRRDKKVRNAVYAWRDNLVNLYNNGKYLDYIKKIIEITDNPSLTSEFEQSSNSFDFDFELEIDFYKSIIEHKDEIIKKISEVNKNQIDLFTGEDEIDGELLKFFKLLIMDIMYDSSPNTSRILYKDLQQIIIDILNEEMEEEIRDRVSNELFNEYRITDGNSDDNANTSIYENIGAELVSLFDGEYGYVVNSSTYNINSEFNIGDDGSVEGGVGVSCEISSPTIRGASNAEQFLIKMFNFIDENGYTNRTCGLHIGVNNVNSTKSEENWLKIAVLFQNDKFATMFNRVGNQYTKSLNDSLIKFINNKFSNPQDFNLEDLSQYEHDFKVNRGNSEKRRSINFLNNNYYEFRVLGGEDYQKKIDEVVPSMYSFAKIIEVASTNEYDEEYKRLLFKLVNRGLKQEPKSDTNNLQSVLKTVFELSKKLPPNGADIDDKEVYKAYHRVSYEIATELNNRITDKSININGAYSILKYLENKGVNVIALRLIERNIDFRRFNEVSRFKYS